MLSGLGSALWTWNDAESQRKFFDLEPWTRKESARAMIEERGKSFRQEEGKQSCAKLSFPISSRFKYGVVRTTPPYRAIAI
jgi:hypothetical protein